MTDGVKSGEERAESQDERDFAAEARSELLDFPLPDLSRSDWVYVLCPTCHGWTTAGCDMPGNRRFISNALREASLEGRRTVRVKPGEPRPVDCVCWKGSVDKGVRR